MKGGLFTIHPQKNIKNTYISTGGIPHKTSIDFRLIERHYHQQTISYLLSFEHYLSAKTMFS